VLGLLGEPLVGNGKVLQGLFARSERLAERTAARSPRVVETVLERIERWEPGSIVLKLLGVK